MHNYGIYLRINGKEDELMIDGYTDPHDPHYLMEKMQTEHPNDEYYIEEVDDDDDYW